MTESVLSKWAKIILRPLAAIFFALAVGAIVISAGGDDPIEAYRLMFRGSIGTGQNLAETIVKTASLTFAGLSYAFAYRCGLMNIGIEGQLIAGAITSSAVGIYLTGLPAIIHVPLCLIAGFAGGALLGSIVVFLKNRFGANEIITTVMFNYVMLNFSEYLVTGPMRQNPNYPQSAPLQDSAKMPIIIPGTRVNIGFILALIAVVLFVFFWQKTQHGFEMKLVGMNQTAARAIGINIKTNAFLSMFIAGGLGGLVGALEILGVQQRLLLDFSAGYGFDGIAVALLGSLNGIGILLSSFLFGSLKSGGNAIQMFTRVPSAVVNIISGFIIIAMTIRFVEFSRKRRIL
jgi:ABC-type uncharacterized transport system permease subunit